MSTNNRSKVLWFGLVPTQQERDEFAHRRLHLEVVTGLVPDFAHARGAVFNAKPPSFPDTVKQLVHVKQALEHGLYVFILVADDASQAYVSDVVSPNLPVGPLGSRLRIRTNPEYAYECAEHIARHCPGPAINPVLNIELPPHIDLTEEHRFLLARAFSDCKAIQLNPLTGGRSAMAFEVQATLTASNAGPRPMPFFAKLDKSHKIAQEQECYRQYADNHIPWHLRPNLQPERCIQGAEYGILVGSFVEHSESLWKVIIEGRGSRYIHSLFENTLLGWRSQSHQNVISPRSMASVLKDVFVHDKIQLIHIEAAQRFGPTAQPAELWECLLNLEYRTWHDATMHGDMHPENVRVRSNDAIIIDLANARSGPLCADLASLEVWLSFQVPQDPLHRPDRTAWKKTVDELYTFDTVLRPPSNLSVGLSIDWLRSSLRQVRMIAATVCETNEEYATATALYLLRRAAYPAQQDCIEEDGFRRAYAYWLGARLVNHLAETDKQRKRAA